VRSVGVVGLVELVWCFFRFIVLLLDDFVTGGVIRLR
jgi:hypothetical protein